MVAPQPRALILRAPGTNCDEETAHAFRLAGAQTERIHINRLIENPSIAARYQILCIPGGFSFGDDIGAGRILAVRLRRHLAGMIEEFVHGRRDCLVLGICNGMQVLMQLGVLTEDLAEKNDHRRVATLTWNRHGRFETRWVHLAVDETPCVFLRSVRRLYLPMAHAEGNFVVANDGVLQTLKRQGRLAIRYCPPAGANDSSPTTTRLAGSDDVLDFPINPNGAMANVAGVCDASGRVFGLMPHPERHIDPLQHPFWTRRETQPERGDGHVVFKNAVEYFG